MKRLAATALILSAAPALAHDGVHILPHASDPNWLPLIAGSVAVGLAALVAWGRK
ncbi:hypothetical protein [Thalassobius vesicularis]|uniref:hypothetical protein n=1 Tax=Thalassobius vesicularis TaxID=1294297 RepID=UPI001454C57B|nr:hypothetical protein [Thalassobius vesicularis]